MINRFDTIARSWDDDYRIKRAKAISEKIDEALELSNNKKVLEFGCGTGLITFNLINKLNYITMVDTSIEMLKIVEEKAQPFMDRVYIHTSLEIFDMNLIPNSYDYIYTSMALHHVLEIESVAKRFYELRHLKNLIIA